MYLEVSDTYAYMGEERVDWRDEDVPAARDGSSSLNGSRGRRRRRGSWTGEVLIRLYSLPEFVDGIEVHGE